MAKINLVQQGADVAYLLLHDPEFRSQRPHANTFTKPARRFVSKKTSACSTTFSTTASKAIAPILIYFGRACGGDSVGGHRRHRAAGTHLRHAIPVQELWGEFETIIRATAGYGKVAVIDELQASLQK